MMDQPTKTRIQYLLMAYLERRETPAEAEQLSLWLEADSVDGADWEELMEEFILAESPLSGYDPGQWQPLLDGLLGRISEPVAFQAPSPTPIRPLYRWRWAAVAAMLFLLAGGLWWLNIRQRKGDGTQPATAQMDVLPGGNKAMLILSGGQRIILDSADNGLLARQGATSIKKLRQGQIAYQPGAGSDAAVQYNTLTTPRGGHYQVTLPDGTRVWLNAASSITYPTTFSGSQRKVTITGEAYLEVAAMPEKPFTVHVNGVDIGVLGTDFNVNAYTDEQAVTTTLLAGRVRVSMGDKTTLLRPGEQALVRAGADNKNAPVEVLEHADLQAAVAWKNGQFAFTDADLPAVMRQLARWYDVDVKYEGVPKKRSFNGEISRSLTLNQVLDGLAHSRIHYTITGPHTLVIQP